MNLRKCEVKAGELVLPIRNCYSLPFVSKPTRRVFNKDAVRCTFSAVCKDSVSREVSKDIEKIQKYGIDRGCINADALSSWMRSKTITFGYYLAGVNDTLRQLESEIENFKRREKAAAQARTEILRLVQGQRTALATGFNSLLGDGGPADETADDTGD